MFFFNSAKTRSETIAMKLQTCHSARRPKSILALLVLAIACCGARCFAQPAEPNFAQPAEPSARQILQSYVQAVGGKKKLESISTMKLVRSEFGRNKIEGKTTEHKKTPTILRSKKRWIKTTTGSTDFGFDGSDYWVKHPKSPKKISPWVLPPFDYRDPVAFPLYLSKHVVDGKLSGIVEFAGEVKIDGKLAYRLKFKSAFPELTGTLRALPKELVFSAETGLPIKLIDRNRTLQFRDYRQVDGIMVSFQQFTQFNVADIKSQYKHKIVSIEFNVEIDEKLLLPVDAVKN